MLRLSCKLVRKPIFRFSLPEEPRVLVLNFVEKKNRENLLKRVLILSIPASSQNKANVAKQKKKTFQIQNSNFSFVNLNFHFY